MSQQPLTYSTSEVAKRLGISTQTVQRWVDSGQLKAWKTLGGHRRIEAEGVELLFRLHGVTAAEGQTSTTPDRVKGGQALSILIVDDNPDDRDILAHLLADALPEATVAAATNGFHGLIAIGRMAPDIVITDVLMPHMNGFEMIRQLLNGNAIRPRLILAVSSNSLAELAPRGNLPEGVVFMQKPLDPDEFSAVLRKAVRTHIG